MKTPDTISKIPAKLIKYIGLYAFPVIINQSRAY
jgi:hypothetical protein